MRSAFASYLSWRGSNLKLQDSHLSLVICHLSLVPMTNDECPKGVGSALRASPRCTSAPASRVPDAPYGYGSGRFIVPGQSNTLDFGAALIRIDSLKNEQPRKAS